MILNSPSQRAKGVNRDYIFPQASKPFRRSGTRRVSRPLARWRKTIESFSSQAQIQYRQGTVLMHFYPLNIDTNHFTLLEINKQEKRIYHYDLMADQGIIDDKVKQTWMGKIVQVSLGS